MRFLVLLLALICGSAQAQILTYKHWPYIGCGQVGGIPCPPDFVMPAGQSHVDPGFPGNTTAQDNTFRKLRDDTGLRCAFAGDFVTPADGLVATEMVIDGGDTASVGEGKPLAGHWWSAVFWSWTFIPVRAGTHTVGVRLTLPVGTIFYTRYAMLQCFEEALGVAQ